MSSMDKSEIPVLDLGDEVVHREDLPAIDAVRECWELWAGGCWEDVEPEDQLEETMVHLSRLFTGETYAEAVDSIKRAALKGANPQTL